MDFIEAARSQKNFRIRCKLLCSSASEMIYFVYSGFGELAHRGLIDLELVRLPNYSGAIYSLPILQVEVDGGHRVVYDASDASVLAEGIDLDAVDSYFKRSYDPKLYLDSGHQHKIFPLAPIYPVLTKHDFWFRRALWASNPRDAVAQVVRSNKTLSRLLRVMTSVYASEISSYEGRPCNKAETQVLFMTRAWSTTRAKLRPEQRAWRERINEIRVACIRVLKKEFGKRFVGGFVHDDFSRQKFEDCLMPTAAMGRKDNYLRLMHQSSVCVTTAGGDVRTQMLAPPHKLGEYIAAAKPIVSEKIDHVLPGDFRSGDNCLEFTTADECLEAAVKLVDNPEKRWDMMCRNSRYYHHYLRPDMAILNTLLTVLSKNSST